MLEVFDLVNLDASEQEKATGQGRRLHAKPWQADRRIVSPYPPVVLAISTCTYRPVMIRRSPYPRWIVFLHGADVDEHDFLDLGDLTALDYMMSHGEMPPAIIAAPDGTYEGTNRITSTHSLFGSTAKAAGLKTTSWPRLSLFTSCQLYSVRPERDAHALLGISAGGYGAMAIAIKHRDIFGAVATIAGPLNMRYDNLRGVYSDDFDPAMYRERLEYEPNMLIAKYYFGLVRRRVKTYLEPVYGAGPDMIAKVARDNPADLLSTTGLQRDELAIYVNYPTRDEYNFDAQDQSFAWLAARRGIGVDLTHRDGRPPIILQLISNAPSHPPTYGSAVMCCRQSGGETIPDRSRGSLRKRCPSGPAMQRRRFQGGGGRDQRSIFRLGSAW